MIRNLKVLGLALVAVLAMSAMVASAASAASFTSASATTNFETTGTNHVFEVTGLAVNCTIATFKGHAATKVANEPISSVTLTPTYTGCTAKLGIFNVNATVTGFGHNGDGGTCDYVVHASGSADLNCSSGEVTVDAGTCTVHVKPQTGLGTISFHNEESEGVKDVNATLNLTKVDVNHTDGFGCPFTGSGSGTIGTLGGTSTVTGKNALGNPVSVSWDA